MWGSQPGDGRQRRPALLAFDLMDTLVTDPYRQAHEAGTGLTWAKFEVARPDGEYHRLERGETDESAYWSSLRRSGIPVDVERFHAARKAGYSWLPGMRELLRDCCAQTRTVIASNYPPWIEDVFPSELAEMGVRVHASWRLGDRKPRAAFYSALAAAEGVTVDQILLVDDNAENIDGIGRLGGLGVLMTGASQVRLVLARLGLDTGEATRE